MHSDFRYAWRAIWKSPSTSLGAMLALALGVGATTTIFGLLNAVLLRPLPYPEADRLVEVWGTVQRQQVERRGTSYPDYFDWRDQARSFDAMSAWIFDQLRGLRAGRAGAASTLRSWTGPTSSCSAGAPIQGRLFQAEDHKPGAAAVAVISERCGSSDSIAPATSSGGACSSTRASTRSSASLTASFTGRSDTAEVWTSVHGTGAARDN